MKEFTKYVAGADSQVPQRLVSLYQRARICQTFPAYRLEDLPHTPATELLQAMELIETVRKWNDS